MTQGKKDLEVLISNFKDQYFDEMDTINLVYSKINEASLIIANYQ